MSAESPYSKIVSAMNQAASNTVRSGECWQRLATVVSVDPLTIDVAGIRASGDMLRINDRLKPHERKIKLKLTSPKGSYVISATDSDGDTTSAVTVSDGTMTYETELQEYWLEAGDIVTVLTQDDQRFYIQDRMVAV